MNDLISKSEVISKIESLISHYSWRLHDNSLSQEDFMVIISGKLNVLKEALISIKKIHPLNLASKSAWISCDDRLPEHLKNVLVCTKKGVVIEAYYDEENKEWTITNSESRITNITHWQPLPEPPERRMKEKCK